MAANKKRKVDGSGSSTPTMMSAFAARQQLWGVAATRAGSAEEKGSESAEETAGQLGISSEALSVRAVADRGSKRSSTEEPAPSMTGASEGQSQGPTTPRPEPGVATVRQHSSFRPSKKNFQRKAGGRLVLSTSEAERFVILGSYGVKVREGEATLAGAILTASDGVQWAHAPHCHAVPVLRTSDETVLELQPHPAAKALRQLAKLNPSFANIWNEPPSEESESGRAGKAPGSFQIVYTPEDVPKRAVLQELASPAEWNKKLSAVAAAKRKTTPVIFLCGPKSSGKSTFGRLLANRLITDRGGSKNKPWSGVMVLDLDPGQPEYSPPGVISLSKLAAPSLSPSFCHPTLAPGEGQLRAHAVASVTPALDPAHFIECALDLFAHYQGGPDAKCPLVINTPGWVQGTGLDILSELIASLRPTEVVYMSQDGPEETVSSLQSACTKTTSAIPFSTLPSQPTEFASRTPLHLRAMQTMSYFHLRQPEERHLQHTALYSWDPTPLTDLRPWCVRYAGGKRGFLGVLCYDHQPARELLAEAINGTVLALVKLESRAALRGLLQALRAEDVGSESDPDCASQQQPEPATTIEAWGEAETNEGEAGEEAGKGQRQAESEAKKGRDSIPLIPNPTGLTLDPRHSRLLSLVLVRGVDTCRKRLHLLAPPALEATITAEQEEGQEKKLVLVAGRFDTPCWAYSEGLYLSRWRARGGGPVGDSESGSGSGSESEAAAERGEAATTEVPWVETLHGSQRRAVGSKVWRVRRDLGRS